MRISRDQMFMEIANIVSRRGTCDRARVGAVMVGDNRNIIGIGYNGSPSGKPHCDDFGHEMVDGHCVRTLHAEVNCIKALKDASWGKDIHYKQLTLYVTHFPCVNCCKAILEYNLCTGNKINRIVYEIDYNAGSDDNKLNLMLLEMGGVTLEKYSNSEGLDNG